MTTNYVWEYKNDNPVSQPKLFIRVQLNKYSEIFNSALLGGLKTYFRGEITSKKKYLIFKGSAALYIMKFLVDSGPAINEFHSKFSEDFDKYPNLAEFEATLAVYELLYKFDGKPQFSMVGHCIKHYLDTLEGDDQLKFVEKFLTVDFLTARYHSYRLSP